MFGGQPVDSRPFRIIFLQGTFTLRYYFVNIPTLKTFSVADPGCLSLIQLFPIPDPNCLHPGSASKNLSILTPKKPKKWFISSRKHYPGCSSRIPDPDADFLPIPDPGSRGQKGIGSGITDPDPMLSTIPAAFKYHVPGTVYKSKHYF